MPTSQWVGVPTTAPNTDRATRAAAFGVSAESEEDRKKRTGVDRGGDGYNSGQVTPAGQAPVNLTGTIPYATPTTTQGTRYTPTAGVPARGNDYRVAQVPRTATPTAGDVTTRQGALTSPASAAGTPRTTTAPASDVTTRQSAITTQPTSVAPGANGRIRLDALGTDANPTGQNTGTTQGQTTVPTGGSASPTVRVLNEVSPGLVTR